MPGPAFKRGDRVSLHPIEEEDHAFIQYGRNHPSTRIPLTDTDIHTLDDVQEMLADADEHFLICVDDQRESTEDGSGDAANSGEDPEDRTGYGPEDGPEPVGVVAFTWTSGPPKSGDMMYWAAPEHRGHGYVTEGVELFLDYAFRECGYHKVTAHALVTNEPSIAVLEGLGFEQEGRFREDHFVNGELVDAYRFGLLADEWLAD
jgi:RimJ/RimL family protein N-acetyltransferase